MPGCGLLTIAALDADVTAARSTPPGLYDDMLSAAHSTISRPPVYAPPFVTTPAVLDFAYYRFTMRY